MVEFECCFLDIEGKQVGPRVSIERENLHGAMERAMELLTAEPRYRGFDLRSEGEHKHHFIRRLLDHLQ
jgi:hypothetical protein